MKLGEARFKYLHQWSLQKGQMTAPKNLCLCHPKVHPTTIEKVNRNLTCAYVQTVAHDDGISNASVSRTQDLASWTGHVRACWQCINRSSINKLE